MYSIVGGRFVFIVSLWFRLVAITVTVMWLLLRCVCTFGDVIFFVYLSLELDGQRLSVWWLFGC